MTQSESHAREWIKKEFKDSVILKIPDYKVTGLSYAAGYPDFLVIHSGKVWFIEVKTWKAKTYTPAQKYKFKEIIDAGGIIYIFLKKKRGFEYFIYK